ncbi:DMT family transporter [Streptomyces klenkii]|uniref:DMT family transporter n=1 Tax=Streptomyces klenkii TaxID=1420899 RepID=UPI003449EE20
MPERLTDRMTGITAGALLALMLHCNSLLAQHTTPVFASWAAHGTGALVALTLVLLTTRRRAPTTTDKRQPAQPAKKAPRWAYLGGIPGALTIMLAAITVNQGLSLAGTIAMMLVGQIVFGLVSDRFGLFHSPKRHLTTTDGLAVLCTLAGSTLIISGGHP